MEKTTDTKPFIKYIAYAQVIGIILVVFGHSFHEYPGGGTEMLIYRMMYSFRMPLFMFVSGFLMVYTTQINNKTNVTYCNFTKKKILRLLLPFVVLSAIAFVPRAMMSDIADSNINLSFDSFWQNFLYPEQMAIPYYWFLHSSFTLLLFNYALITLGKKLSLADKHIYLAMIVIPILLQILPVTYGSLFTINQTIMLAPYFAIGAICCRYSKFIDPIFDWSPIKCLIITVALWATLFYIKEGEMTTILCSLCGIAMCLSLAKLLVKHNVTVLDRLIGANYLIFLLSWFMNVCTQQVLSHFVTLPWWCYTTLSLTLGIYVPWFIYQLICTHSTKRSAKIIAFLLGQNLKKTTKY